MKIVTHAKQFSSHRRRGGERQRNETTAVICLSRAQNLAVLLALRCELRADDCRAHIFSFRSPQIDVEMACLCQSIDFRMENSLVIENYLGQNAANNHFHRFFISEFHPNLLIFLDGSQFANSFAYLALHLTTAKLLFCLFQPREHAIGDSIKIFSLLRLGPSRARALRILAHFVFARFANRSELENRV